LQGVKQNSHTLQAGKDFFTLYLIIIMRVMQMMSGRYGIPTYLRCHIHHVMPLHFDDIKVSRHVALNFSLFLFFHLKSDFWPFLA
jgi:hypothetical protein